MEQYEKLQNIYIGATGIRKYIFSWIYPLIEIGKQRALIQADIPQINKEDGTQWNFYNFKRELQFGDRSSTLKPFCVMVWKNFKFQLLVILAMHFIISSVQSLHPILVNSVVQLFLNDRPNYPLFARTFIQFIVYQLALMVMIPAYIFLEVQLQIKLNGALKGLIVDKTLVVSYPLPSSGDMQNLLMVDIHQITGLINSYVNFAILPIQLVLKIWVYFEMLGKPALVGIIVLVFQCLCNLIYAKYYARNQANIMRCKDARMRSINELICGINMIKQNGYYNFFSTRLADRRYQEIKSMRNQKILTIFVSLISGCFFPITVIYITFKYFEIFDLANIMAVQLNYFSLVDVVNNIPGCISSILIGGISIKRVMNFLHLKENEEQAMDSYSAQDDVAIQVEKGSFVWNKAVKSLTNMDFDFSNRAFMLDNISLKILKGESVLILGRTGSGKTSLMYSMLGELEEQGLNKFQTFGSISIAQQEPFMQQESILSNIIQQEILDKTRLIQILDTTQLMEEFQLMQSGINTEVGENGSSLSGGQCKRIHLSRSLYQDKDIYLLDSPLTSLDPEVSKQLAQKLIQLLKGKTLVIFSNSTQYWSGVDRVIVLEEGRIVQQGTYNKINQDEKYRSENEKDNQIHPQIMVDQTDLFQSINKQSRKIIEAEDRQTGSIPTQVFKTLYQLFGRWPILVICGVCIRYQKFSVSLCGMSFSLYYQSYLSHITEISGQESATDEQKAQTADNYLFLFPFLFGGRVMIELSRHLVLMLKGFNASLELHSKIINNLLRASVQKFYNVTLASRIKNRLSGDIHNFDINMAGNLSTLFDGCFKMLSLIIGSFFFSTVYTYPAQIIFIFLVYYMSRIYLKSIIEIFRLEALSKSPMLNHFQEIVHGLIYFRHCSNTQQIKNKFFDIVDVQLRNMVTANALAQWFRQTTNLLFIFIYTSVLIVNYYDLNLNQQQASIALYISIGLSQSIFAFITDIQQSYAQMIFFQRCDYLVNQIPSDDEHYEYGLNYDNTSPKKTNFMDPTYKKQVIPALKVTNLIAKYRQDTTPVLKNISFSIYPGEKIAIIGRTGSGKSSLIQCITKIIDYQSGDIQCYGIGYDHKTIDDIRQNFSVISQNPFIFEGTILQNIDPLGFYPNEADLLKVIGHEFQKDIDLLRNLNAQVGELGANISLGERQLIVILRVMLQKRRIVILDECTGSLDKTYAVLINDMLKHYLKDKTVISVTHQLENIKEFDRVILMQQGSIKIIGPVEEILKDSNICKDDI